MTLDAGSKLGPYAILGPLGSGGMGEVYRARDMRLGREVAIKVLPEGFSSDPDRLRRFEREARAASALSHPNILTIHDVGIQNGVPYVVFELLEGETLRAQLAGGPIPVRRAVAYGVQVAQGLAAAHEKGIVHRDLKPENLFLTADGRVKILDFGLALVRPLDAAGREQTAASRHPRARSDLTAVPTVEAPLTEPGVLMGTLGYMSPEQVRGETADSRSDIFSFGAVLYELLTGRKAFRGNSPAETLSAILREEPEDPSRLRPEASAALDRVLRRCLEKNPSERFQSARDLAFALNESSGSGGAGSSPQRAVPTRHRWALVTAAAVLVIVAVLFATDALRGRRRPGRIQSLAVLPLQNYSRDPEQEYFADGMTDELITSLAQIGSLHVVSRTSAMRYKGTHESVPEIARELHVDGVLEGSVQREGNRVRITAQLIDASTDRHVWAKSYERDLKDVLSLQGEVAQAIAGEIGVRLTPQERSRLAEKKTVDPDAYEAYLKGRYHIFRKTAPETEKGLEYFQKAAAMQPDYALAYAGIADAYAQMAGSAYDVLSPKEAYPKSKAAAKRALELDPMLAEAYTSLAWVSFVFDRDWAAAESQFRQAIARNPNYPDVHQTYGVFLARMGRFEEALGEAKRAQELDPLSLYFETSLASALRLARHDAEAISWFRRVLDLDANFLRAHWGLGLTLAQVGKYGEAIPELEKAVEMSEKGPAFLGSLGFVYAASNRRPDAEEIVEQLEQRSKTRYVPPCTVAIVFAGLGETDRSLDWLEKGDEERDPWITDLKVNFMFDSLRSNPRFQSLLHRIGLS